jgi:hypothetical protein
LINRQSLNEKALLAISRQGVEKSISIDNKIAQIENASATAIEAKKSFWTSWEFHLRPFHP